MSVSALATTVSGVTATQHWPWDGKVDISYTLTATSAKTTPVFAVSFQGQIGDDTAFTLTALEGDGAAGITLGAGSKRVVWDSKKQSETSSGVQTTSLQVAVTAQDVTDEAAYLYVDFSDPIAYNLSTPVYKIKYSSSAPTVGTTDEGRVCKASQMWFKRIEDGTFTMGSSYSEIDRASDGSEQEHVVAISKAFYIGVFELTGSQENRIKSGTYPPPYGPPITENYKPTTAKRFTEMRGEDYGITWPTKTDHRVDSTSVLGKLRSLTGNGLIFDLPTEAQWELACRDKGDGTYYGSEYLNDGTHFSNEAELVTGLMNIAWFKVNSSGSCQEVGTKNPGTNGLYDMHGNLTEMCLDWYQTIIFSPSTTTDPVGPATGEERICRGGSYYFEQDKCRIATRQYHAPQEYMTHHGFRFVLIP